MNHHQQLVLSPSKIEAFLSCRLKYYLQYVLKIKPDAESLNLVYGTLIHSSVEAYLTAWLAGDTSFDIVAHFIAAWDAREAQQGISWNDGGKMLPADVPTFARHALRAFVQWWETGEYQLVIDPNGLPVIERNIKLDLGENVLMWMKLDVLLQHVASGLYRVFDLKTPASASMEQFNLIAPQLTSYEVGCNMASQELGMGNARIDGTGFIEMCKTKSMGKLVVSDEFRPRNDKLVREWLQLIRGIAHDIRAGRFERQPGMSHSPPCGYCDCKNMCCHGKTQGLKCRTPIVHEPW